MANQNPLELRWVVSSAGDRPSSACDVVDRAADVSNLRRVAEAAASLGFRRALIPVGPHGEDAWIVATWRRPTKGASSRASRPMRARASTGCFAPPPKRFRAAAAAR